MNSPTGFPVDPSLVFSVASGLAILSWLALAVSPYRAPWARPVRIFSGLLVPQLLAVVYVAIFAATGMAGGGYDSLEAVQRLFAVPELLTAGWLHFLAFDLFVGAWISEHAGELGIPHFLVLPLLALTFMFGPAGLLAYALVRVLWMRRRPVPQPA